MKIDVDRLELLKALDRVKLACVKGKSTLPILNYALFELQDGILSITQTDLETRIRTSIQPKKVYEPGTCLLPVKKLAKALRLDWTDVVRIEIDALAVIVASGKTSFNFFPNRETNDFPLFNEPDIIPALSSVACDDITFKMSGWQFGRSLLWISRAVSLDDSRRVLHGILFERIEDNINFVSTDGKRLFMSEVAPEKIKGDKSKIVKLDGVQKAIKLFKKSESIRAAFGEKYAAFKDGETTLITKLAEGNYPNYRQVVPSSFAHKFSVPREQFHRNLKLALICEPNWINFKWEQSELSIDAQDQDKQLSFKGGVETSQEAPNPVKMSISGQFLDDFLKDMIYDTFQIRLNDGYSPVMFADSEAKYVIMPMRNK
jgi:DNA polymerase-3 subunit beta